MSSLVDLDPFGLGADASKPVEYTLAQISECFIYRVTATHSARGYRADDWDLANPFATAELIVNQCGTECFIRFYKKQQGGAMRQLLAECPLELTKPNTRSSQSSLSLCLPVAVFGYRIKDRKRDDLRPLGRVSNGKMRFIPSSVPDFSNKRTSSESSGGNCSPQ